MTRAQSQVVAWWAPSWDEPNGGLSRLLRGRRAGRVGGARSLCAREDLGRRRDGAAAEVGGCGRAGDRGVRGGAPAPRCRATADDVDLDARHFHRAIDTAWRRTSYSGLIRVAETTRGQQRAGGRRAGRRGRRDSAWWRAAVRRRTCRRRWRICRRARSSARWCTRCWRRPTRSRLIWPPSWSRRSASIRCGGRSTSSRRSWRRRWCRCTTLRLGPLADGVTLRQIGLQDRLREMDFEFPLGGRGSARSGTGHPAGSTWACCCASICRPTTRWRRYADRLTGDALGGQSLRGI